MIKKGWYDFFHYIAYKKAEGLKDYRQVVKCEARNPC